MDKKFLKGALAGVVASAIIFLTVNFGITVKREYDYYKNHTPAVEGGFTVTQEPQKPTELVVQTQTPVVTTTPAVNKNGVYDYTLVNEPVYDPIKEYQVLDSNTIQNLQYLEWVIKNYYYKDVSADKIRTALYRAMFSSIGDPYTQYYTAEEFAEFQSDTSGVYYGIGAYVSQDKNTLEITIANPFKNGPADKAGMLKGDVIKKVDDTDVVGMDLEDVVKLMKGPEDTHVFVTIGRGNDELVLDIVRGKVDVPSIEHEMLEGNIGYISVTSFNANTFEASTETGDSFKKAIDDLVDSQKAKGLIIDLRNNGGGLLDVCCDMADYILPDGRLIVSTDGYAPEGMVSRDGHKVTIPIVVLVNEYSASASEVFTGALKDNGVATVIGVTSYGKGIVQTLQPLTDYEETPGFKITISSYYTPSGKCIHGEGITPDVVVEYEEEDNQKEAALQFLLDSLK